MLIALTREVSPRLGDCELTHLSRRPVDVARAAAQHAAYERALETHGCTVKRLPATPELPDGVFVEDAAVIVDEVAVITRPGAASRRPETRSLAAALGVWRELAFVRPPATLEGGDVLRLGRTVYVGRSTRSNAAGLARLREVLGRFGYRVEGLDMGGCLHLKTAVTQVSEQAVLLNPHFVAAGAFRDVEVLEVDPAEPLAANVLRIGDAVLCAAEHERTRRRLEARGVAVHALAIDELTRAEAGPTCCSVIFEDRPAGRPGEADAPHGTGSAPANLRPC